MGGLLRSAEMDQIERLYSESFDLTSGLVLFPVRHHSPACSLHLRRVLDDYQPDAILIEGPANANHLLPVLGHAESQAPFCIYAGWVDKQGVLGEKEGKFASYYPFLDYSPELVAIRIGLARGIETRFIDLPHAEKLLSNKSVTEEDVAGNIEEADGPSKARIDSDEYLMARSRFIQRLLQQENCRTYSELWEKWYELDGLRMDTKTFVRNMTAFCYYARVGYTEEMLDAEGCLAREAYMVEQIREAMQTYRRVLVVTGGFHVSGLLAGLQSAGGTGALSVAEAVSERAGESTGKRVSQSASEAVSEQVGEPISAKQSKRSKQPKQVKPQPVTVDPATVGVYAMAYSFEESDRLGGYQSGMPYPAFYQRVWQGIEAGAEHPYEQAVLQSIVRTAGRIRKKDGVISTADEIQAFQMARGLQALRDKAECGVYELLDSVRTAFVKEEIVAGQTLALSELSQVLRGRKIGTLCAGADVPPIVIDFREQAKRLKLKLTGTVTQEVTLDIYRNAKHRELSRFLHRMEFFNIGFCKKVKGPDYAKKRNTNLVREAWKYKWSAQMESSLIELSIHGGSLREAAGDLLARQIGTAREQAGEAARLLIEAFHMGLEAQMEENLPELQAILSQDGSFYSVTDCTYHLNFLQRAMNFIGAEAQLQLTPMIEQAYHKAVYLLAGLAHTSDDQENDVINRLKDLYFLSSQSGLDLDRERLSDALFHLIDTKDCNSAIEGAALGLLWGLNRMEREAVNRHVEGYLYSTGEHLLRSGSFLKGLFAGARDLLLSDNSLMEGINHVLLGLDEEDFLKILPDLRLAFTFFTPREVYEIGGQVAGLFNLKQEAVLSVAAVDPQALRQGLALDAWGVERLQKWGMLDG